MDFVYNLFDIRGLIIGVFVVLAAYFYIKLRSNARFFEKRGVNFITPNLLLGSDLDGALLRKHLVESWDKIYYSLKGYKIGGFFQYTQPFFMVTDPEYVNTIYTSEFSSFQDRGFLIDEEVNPLDGNLFLLSGAKWRFLRAKLSPIFTSGKLRWMYNEMEKCCDSFLSYFNKIADSKDIDTKEMFSGFTIDVIGSCAFGIDTEAIKNPDSEFKKMGKKVFEVSLRGGLILFGQLFFPKLFKRLKIQTTVPEVKSFFFSIMEQTFHHRIKTGKVRKDFVQLLLELREKGSVEVDALDKEDNNNILNNLNEDQKMEKLELTNELLTAQSFVFFAAGFETTSSTLYELSLNTAIQDRVREEIKRVKAKFGTFSYEAIKGLVYLDKCISETLRLYPPVPHIFRECTKAFTFPDGTKIEKGDKLILPVYSIQRDENNFPEPKVYRPERFDEPPKRGTYAPFGDGPRMCIGKRFALLEIKMTLCRILDEYQIDKSMNSKLPMEFKPGSFVLVPKQNIYVKIRKLS